MTSFSRGMPGLGLLILRLAVSIDLIAVASRSLIFGWAETIPFASAILGFLLVVGFFTGYSACLGGLLVIVSVFVMRDLAILPALTVLLLCLALALAGPGGYSFDALLWGPRRITYPGE